MKFSKLFSASALVFSLISSSVHAFTWDEWSSYDTIYQRGNWVLDLNEYTDGSRSCESRTDNNNYRFSIFTLSGGDYIIQFANDEWSFGEQIQDQDFIVRIDRRSPWNISGSKLGSGLSMRVTPPESSLHRFFGEIRRGNTLYLSNERGTEIARFSLRGTTATLNQHENCERRILNGVSRIDPFN